MTVDVSKQHVGKVETYLSPECSHQHRALSAKLSEAALAATEQGCSAVVTCARKRLRPCGATTILVDANKTWLHGEDDVESPTVDRSIEGESRRKLYHAMCQGAKIQLGQELA